MGGKSKQQGNLKMTIQQNNKTVKELRNIINDHILSGKIVETRDCIRVYLPEPYMDSKLGIVVDAIQARFDNFDDKISAFKALILRLNAILE